MNLSQMRTQVVQWLGLQDLTSYSETSIVEQQLFNGTVDLLSRTRCVVRCVQLRTVSGQDEYTLDQGIISLVDLEDGNRWRLRRDQNLSDPMPPLYGQYYGPEPLLTSPYGFMLIRSDVLRIVPMPAEDGLLVQTWAVLRPQQMSADTDSPDMEQFGAIPDEFHDAIVGYALWKCADYTDDTPTQNGEYYRVLYEGQDGRGGRLSQIRILINKRGTARGIRSRVRLTSPSASGAYTG